MYQVASGTLANVVAIWWLIKDMTAMIYVITATGTV